MKKTFDCVEFKLKIQEKMWIEAGENFEGLIHLLDKRREKNELLKQLIKRKEKQLENA
ncbi:MAG: hypothetical protein HZB41_09850 [Ignavibacteriae bacterium]|nr:hypothetical protein [Ignavibacteriota bacterium]